MTKRLIVSDVSGTITDLEEGAVEFNRRFVVALARAIQVPTEDVVMEVEVAMQAMDADPDLNGWQVGNEIVAPATADPYVRMRAAVELVLDRHGLMLNHPRREGWLDRIFEQARKGTPTVFKPGALSYLALMDQHHGAFMCNGEASTVQSFFQQFAEVVSSQAGLALLQEEFRAADEETRRDVLAMLERSSGRVHGEACRQMVEPMFQVCDAELSIPGLGRPVLLHRGRYFQLLRQLMQQVGVNWDHLWVVGDIFEFDLAMPWALGANVVMIDNGVMPDYERAWLATQERAHVTETLTGACEILFS